MEILLVAGILVYIIYINNKSELRKFIVSNDSAVNFLREKDYDFYVIAKYGSEVDPNILYSNRVKNTGLAFLFSIILFNLMRSINC